MAKGLFPLEFFPMSKASPPLDPAQVNAAARRFAPAGAPLAIQPYGSGNINDTFLVTPLEPGEEPFLLQRLNQQVFPQPDLVLANCRIVCQHLAGAAVSHGERRLEVPRLLSTQEGQDWFIDAERCRWRAFQFLSGTHAFDIILDPAQAREVGWALGRFHRLLRDLPPERLADTLPGFHITPLYLQRYDEVLARTRPPGTPEVRYAQAVIEARRGLAQVLETGKDAGILPLRVIHGDPKVNNFLFDAAGRAVALVDLDTVKPGLVHYDLGDCLRSAGNPLGEETEAWEEVRFEPELARGVLQGYLEGAGGFLGPKEYDYLGVAARLLAFELGLRFFTDYLAGNVYFKVKHPEHNLRRALVQFKLTESIEAQSAALEAILRDAGASFHS